MDVKQLITKSLCCVLFSLSCTASANCSFGNDEAEGAAQYIGKHDIKNSQYFAQPDIYNLKSNNTLTIISNFKTRQQHTGYTCGPVSASMVVENLLGRDLHNEKEIFQIMGTSTTKGTDCKGMVKYFKMIGWNVESNFDKGSPEDYESFLKFVKDHLQEGTPIMVENVDWGGHWRVIIGYDTMGSEHTGDDVLIMADPYDTSDHLQDGYNIVSADRFYSEWFDAHLFKSSRRDKQWLAAKPK